MLNTGARPVKSYSGLLTTLGYKLGDQPAVYALEGSIAITGALVQWFRDNIGLIGSAPEIETLALTVRDRLAERRARTAAAHYATNPRWVYYLSAEFLLGPQLEQNLLYTGTGAAAAEALK